MFQSGLLILTSPVVSVLNSIPKILTSAASHVQNVLYVHLAPGLHKTTEVIPKPIPCTTLVQKLVTDLYMFAANHHQRLDLRVIVGNVGEQQHHARPAINKYVLQYPYEVLLTNTDSQSVLQYAKRYFTQTASHMTVEHISVEECDDIANDETPNENLETFDNVVLGGTFDRLHTGHKILLNEALIRCNKRLVVGVTDGPMNQSKLLPELIEPCDVRISNVCSFLEDVKPQLSYYVTPIIDPYGPSITESDLQCIIVSQETIKGGQSVNKKRLERNLNELTIVSIGIVQDKQHEEGEEEKISSSSLRRRLLGTLLRQPVSKPSLQPSPYIIGLTGGIASGKSSIGRRLQHLGAAVVDCDALGHLAYERGGAAYNRVVKTFGIDVLDSEGNINRKILGSKVFSNPEARQMLNDIVWPVIRDLAQQQIETYHGQGYKVVILDAAVLLEAGWDDMVHEVWTTVIPINEAVERIKERNKLEEEEAKKRILSQMSNEERVKKANVVLCTLWEYSITQKQVEKAWSLLQQRLPVDQSHL